MIVPRIIPRAEHPISRGYIDPDALRVLYRLHRAGFKAFLVGGSVRDLMTGRTPKDFDIGTDAKPQEIRRLFRNSRIIGRRFRLAHILFEHGKVVEVSTFRRQPDADEGEQKQNGEADLLIRSDNTFGTPEQDALRRDFTINGLFYDIATFAVLDYVGGVGDLEKRLVRAIGDPVLRFREDPVRMMRACEFAGRLGFSLTEDVSQAMVELKGELRKSAAARVTEELLDPLRRGWGTQTYRHWFDMGLLDVLFPELEHALRMPGPNGGEILWKMMGDSDARTSRGEILADSTLLGLLFLPMVFGAIRSRAAAMGGATRLTPQNVLLVLEEVVNPPAARLSLPNLTVHMLKQGLYTMGRLASTRPTDPAAKRLLVKPFFATALALLDVYSRASGRYQENAAAWQEVGARPGRKPKHHDPAEVLDPEATSAAVPVGFLQASPAQETPSERSESDPRSKGRRRGRRRTRHPAGGDAPTPPADSGDRAPAAEGEVSQASPAALTPQETPS